MLYSGHGITLPCFEKGNLKLKKKILLIFINLFNENNY